MTIVVGKQSNKCFQSTDFKEAFRKDLVSSVKAMNTEVLPATSPIMTYEQRRAGLRKLALREKTPPPSLASATYYGQQR